MRYLTGSFLLIFLIVAFPDTGRPQSDGPKLLGKFRKGDISEFNYRLVQNNFGTFKGKSVVIRICTAATLADALATAPGVASSFEEPYGLRGILDRYDGEVANVYFATYAGCTVTDTDDSLVEYWLVSDTMTLDTDNIRPAAEIQIAVFTSSTNSEFRIQLDKFAGSLKVSGGRGYVIAAYNRSPSKELRSHVELARKSLSGLIRSAQYNVVYNKHEGVLDSGYEPRFPRLVLVKLGT